MNRQFYPTFKIEKVITYQVTMAGMVVQTYDNYLQALAHVMYYRSKHGRQNQQIKINVADK